MRVKTFICGANFTQLGLPVFAPQDVLLKGVFSNIYHNIVPRVNGFAHICIIYQKQSQSIYSN